MENKKIAIGLGFLLLGYKVFAATKEVAFTMWDSYSLGHWPRSSTSSYATRDLSQIDKIIIHHPAASNQTGIDYANYHVYTKGWPGIGYHIVIERDGKIEMGNPLNLVSYHTSGQNTNSVGIVLSGNMDIEQPTAAQMKSLDNVITYLRQELPQPIEVDGHRDYANKTCPGANLYPLLAQYKLNIWRPTKRMKLV